MRLSFEDAKRSYPHRFTMEHVPKWAKEPIDQDGMYYAPQFVSDREWYVNTVFPGESGLRGNCEHCITNGQTWPLGLKLDKPYTKGQTP